MQYVISYFVYNVLCCFHNQHLLILAIVTKIYNWRKNHLFDIFHVSVYIFSVSISSDNSIWAVSNIEYDIQIKDSEHQKLRPQTFHILQCPIGDCIRPIYFQTIYHPAIADSQRDWFVNQGLHFGKDYTTILHLLFPKTLILRRKAISFRLLCYDNQY